MKYPDELVQTAQERAGKEAKLEGINNGAGPMDAKIMFVGEAPGRNEIIENIPFTGAAGRELMASLQAIGLTREDVYITSAVRSRPYSIKERINKRTGLPETTYPNRKPTQREVKAHAILLDYEIQEVQPQIIVTLGDVALKRLLGNDHQIKTDHGKVFHQPILELNEDGKSFHLSKRRYTIIPMYHPAAVFYNRSLETTIKEDFTVLKKELDKENGHE